MFTFTNAVHNIHKVVIIIDCLFAGKEWKYVILSTVRSLSLSEIDHDPPKQWLSDHLGIVADPHQVNVALTRAKCGLIIIGIYTCICICISI